MPVTLVLHAIHFVSANLVIPDALPMIANVSDHCPIRNGAGYQSPRISMRPLPDPSNAHPSIAIAVNPIAFPAWGKSVTNYRTTPVDRRPESTFGISDTCDEFAGGSTVAPTTERKNRRRAMKQRSTLETRTIEVRHGVSFRDAIPEAGATALGFLVA